MLFESKQLPFTDLMIRSITDSPGVYALWNREKLLYIGRTGPDEGLRAALESHARDQHPVTIPCIYDFQYEVHGDPKRRQDEVLRAFRKRAGRLPPYNEKSN